jgi:hypothetical protein
MKQAKLSNEQYTPNTDDQPIIDLAIKVLGAIDVDPCSNSKINPNVPAKHHYTVDDNSLVMEWVGTHFLNPPYSNPHPFLERLVNGFKLGDIPEAIALLKSGTQHNKGTGRLIEEHASAICQWGAGKNRRIGFINQNGEQKMSADFDCILVYFGKNWTRFYHTFEPYGHVMATSKTIKNLILTP